MTNHPCQDKCSNFTDEQCCHCLVQQDFTQEAVVKVSTLNVDESKHYNAYLEAMRYAP